MLADPAVEIVAARRPPGRRDPAPRVAGATFTNVFDTQVAAGFAGLLGAGGLQRACCTTCCSIRLPKSASFTRWDARPLTDEQVRYARERRRAPAAARRRDLQRGWSRAAGSSGRARSAARSPRRPTSAIPRRSGGGCRASAGLDPRERAVARELAAWRERTAAAEDRPVGAVVRDPTVVELAKRQPAEPPRAGPDPRRRTRTSCAAAADDIIAAIERGREARADPARRGRAAARPSPQDGPVIALAEALVRARAQEAGLAYELIAARADLAPIVVSARRGDAEPDVRTLRGWRRELVGAELLELLAGRRALPSSDGGRVQVSERAPA